MLRLIIFQRFDFFLYQLRHFKLQLRCIFHHYSLEIGFCLSEISLDNSPYGIYFFIILLLAFKSFAGTSTVFDVIFQTDAVFALFNFGRSKIQIAGTQFINMPNGIQQNFRRPHLGIRSVIFRAILNKMSRQENPRKILFLNANPGIGFVVLQHDIVKWLMFFDQIILQQQRIVFARHDRRLEVIYFADHNPRTVSVLVFIEIRGHSFLQIFGLSDI